MSLIDTNPYLKDPKERRKMFWRNAITSTAIEGVDITQFAQDMIISEEDKELQRAINPLIPPSNRP